MSKTLFGRLQFIIPFFLLLFTSGTAFAVLPRVHHIYISGINPGPNPANAIGMKVGTTLRLYYTYADPDAGASQLESGTLFQWYTYTLEDGTGKTPIAGATGSTLTLTAAMENLYVGVEIRARNVAGEVGTAVEFRPFSTTNKNKVLKNTFTCGKAGGGTVSFGNNLDASAPLCSPRVVNWQIDYTGVDYNAANPPRIFINWADGGGFTQYVPTLVNALLTRNDTINLTNQSNQLWRTNQSHTFNYPTTGGTSVASTTVNQVCTYNIQVTWGVGGSCAAAAPGNVQTAPFTVWDRENNTNLGVFDINKVVGTGGVEVGEVTNICEKDQTPIRLQDASDFNCTSIGGIRETVTENTEGRWMQWVYGTTGSDVQTNVGATEKIVINGVSYTLAQMPVYGRVWWQPPATTAPTPAVTDDIIMPTSGTSGRKLMVTLRSWNFCNQLDRTGAGFAPVQGGANNVQDLTSVSSGVGSTQPILYTAALFNKPVGTSIFANATAVERTYTIMLISKPPAPSYTTPNFCEINGGTPTNADYNITFGNGAAGYTMNVYLTNLATVLRTDNASPFTFNPVTDPAVAGNRIDVTPPPNNPNTYHRFATYTASNNCVSDPLDITLNIYAQKTGGTFAHSLGASPQPICSGDNPVAFATTGAGTSNPGGGDFNALVPATLANDIYQWQSSPDGSVWSDIVGETNIGFDPPALTATTYYRRRVREAWHDITGGCDEAFSNVYQIIVHTTPTGGTIGNPQTLCSGVTAPGTITSVTAGTGGNGTPGYQWQSSTDNFGAVINTIAGANADTYTPPTPLTQTTYYRRVNTSGMCPTNFAFSNVITLTVQPTIVPGTISSSQAICFNQTPTALTGTASTGGNGTPTYQWEISTTSPGTGGFANVGGATGQNYSPPALTVTTWYRRLTTAGVCAPQYSNTVQITVNPLPGGDVTGGGSICTPPPTDAPDIQFTFNLGTGPWDLVYSINGVNQPAVIDTGTPYDISAPGLGVYRIVSITDANGCTVTAPHANITTTGLASVVVGGAPPAFDTAPGLSAAAVCSNGASTTDPVLDFNLNAASTTTGANYVLTYKVNAITPNRTKTFRVDAAGDIIQVNGAAATTIVFNDTEFNTVGAQTLTLVSILSPTGCQSLFNTPFTFTINPLPVGANKTLTAACTPQTINIDIFNTSVATAAGGNNVASTYTWTANFNGMTNSGFTGNGNIAGTLTNTTNVQRSAVFTVTATSTATPACAAASTFTITVPIDPRPAIPDQTATICSATAFSVSPTNGGAVIVPAGTQYTWTIPAPNANITGASAQGTAVSAPISQTLTNTTNTVQTLRYVVTPVSGSCSGTAFNLDVTVNPKPSLVSPIDVAICSGGTFNVSPTNGSGNIVPAGTTYQWAAPTMPGGVAGGSAAGAGQVSISQTLTNASTSPQVAVYTVTPTAPAGLGGCAGSNFLVRVTVNPIPVLSSSLTPPGICSGNFSYTPTSLTPGATFSWTRANVAGINESANAGSGPISETLTNPTTAPVDVVYVVTTTANGCPNSGQNVTVRVNPTPIPNAILGPANVCVGTNPFFYSVTQRPGSTYSWEIPASFTVEAAGGGVVAGGGPGPFSSDYFILLKFATPTGPGGLQIKVIEKSADGCIGLANVHTIVAASSPPTVPIAGGSSFCKFEKGVVFSVPQNASSTFTWSVNSGATIIGPSAGTNLYQIIVDFNSSPSAQIDVTETNVTGCPANYPSLIVSLLDAPVITPSTGNICSGAQPSSVINLPALTSVASNYSWFVKNITGTLTGAFVNDAGTGPLEHFPPLKNVSGSNATITYTVTPTATASPFCIGVPVDITVTVKPEPVVNTIADQSICPQTFVNGTVSFPLTSNVAGALISWTNNNPAIGLGASGTGNISFTTADNLTGANMVATITVTAAAAGCTSTGSNAKTFTITVKPRPVITTVTDITVCPGDAVNVPAFVSNTGGGESYSWTNDNASIGLVLSGSNNIAGYFAPTNTTGADVVGNISVTSTKNSCAGPPMNFKITVRSNPLGAAITRAAQCSNVPFSVSSINITNGMGATSTYTWVRNALPAGLVEITPGTGTGTTIAETLRNMTSATLNATYNVTPKSAANCTGSAYIVTVPINPEPVGSPVTRPAQCSGVTFSVSPDNISNGLGGTSSYTWVRGALPVGLTQLVAGSGSGQISERLQNQTSGSLNATYTVTPTSASGCVGDPYVVTVPISPEPVGADITRAAQCSNVPFSVSASNITNGVAGATFAWTRNALPGGLTVVTAGSGNGAIAETLRNVTGGQLSATYTVIATAASCAGASYIVTVPVNPEPVGGPVTRAAQCSNVPFSVSADNISNGVAGSTFTWVRNVLPAGLGLVTAGTGTGAIAETLSNTTGGTLSATYTVTPVSAGCTGATYVVTVPITPEPVGANMTATPQCSNVGFSIDPNNVTNGLGLTSTYTWSRNALPAGLTQVTGGSGSGMIAETLRNLTSGQLSAVYVVTATSASGCVGVTYNITVPVNPEPVGADVTRAAQCSNVSFSVSAVNISNGLGATSSYTWTRNILPAGLVLVTSGTGSGATITETLRNLSGGQLTATYVVTPKSVDNCTGATYVISVPIDSEPVGVDITRAAECSSVPFNVNPDNITNGMGGTSTYTWVRQALPAGLVVSVPGSGSGMISETLRNPTSSPLNAKYTVTPRSAANCTGTSYVITIPINPEPVGANITRAAQCSNVAFSVNADNITNGLGAVSTYTWTRNPLSAGLTVVSAGTGTGNIAETLRNQTSGQLSASYTVTATSPAGCASTPYVVTVPINPEPVGADITRAAQCSNVAFNLSADNITNGLGPSSSYTWTRDPLPAGLTQVVGGTGNGAIAETLRNQTNGSLSAVYVVTPVSSSGCTGATYRITVPISPEPVGATITRANECSSVAYSVSPDNITNGVVGTTFTWVRQALPAGLTALSAGSGSGSIDETMRNLTGGTLNVTYRVTPSVGGCAGQTYDIIVPIDSEPVGTNVTRPAQCSGLAFSVSANNISNGLGATSTYAWVRQTLPAGLTEITAGTGTGAIAETLENKSSVQLSATYVVTPTSAAGCVGASYVVTVPINPEPVGADITRAAQCSNAPFSVSADNITNGLGASSTYTWVRDALPAGLSVVTAGSGSGPIAETLRNLTGGSISATYTVTPKSSASCNGDTYVITVPISPEPVGTDITRAAECSNKPFSVSADNITNGVVGTTFTWVRQTLPVGLTQVTGGTGSGAIAETLKNVTSGSLDAKYTVTPSTGGCVGQTYVITIPVNPEPVGGDVTRAVQCSNQPFSVSADNVTNGVIGSTFTWVRDNLPVGLSLVTAGTGNGAIAETIRNITGGQLSATYKVTPTSGAGCVGAVYTITVPINPEPVGNNVTRTAECSNVAFSVDPNNITNGLGGTSAFTWVRDPLPAGLTQVTGGSGTGMISEKLRNLTSGQLNATYKVTPTSTNGCVGDVYVVTIPINPEPVGADITRAAQCSNVGFSVSAINITNSIGGTSTYTWTRNALPGGLTAVVSGSGTGGTINETLRNLTGGQLTATYTVTPTSADGCLGATYIVSVPVDSEPVGVNVTRAAQCSGLLFSVSADNLTNGMGATSTYSWVRQALPLGLTVAVSGSGTGLISEMLRNTTAGQLSVAYTVTPRSAAGCFGNSYTVTIPIDPEPLGANFTRAEQCSNIAFSVSPDNISNGLGATSTYAWIRNPLPGGLTQVAGGTGTGPIAETLRNLSGVQLTASYVVTPTSAAGCVGGSYTIFVPINSEPVGADITRAQACSNVSFTASADNITNGMGSTSSYTWIRQALPGGLSVVTAGTGTGNITETLRNLSSGQLNAKYTVTPKSASGCTGVAYVITVPVNPEPVGANVTRASQCSDSPFIVSADNITNGVIGATFTWVRQPLPGGLTAIVNGDGTGDIEETLRNLTGGTLNAVYRVTPTAGVCAGATYDVTVPIFGEPVMAVDLNQTRCSDVAYGRLLNTNGLSEPASSYDVEVMSIDTDLTGTRTVGLIGNNLPNTAIQADVFTNKTANSLKVVYKVTPHGVNCTGDPILIEFVIAPEPVIPVITPVAVCSRANTGIVLGTNGTSIAAQSYQLTDIQYSLNGGAFGAAPPARFTPNGTNRAIGFIGDVLMISADAFTNLETAFVDVRYTVVPTSSGGCVGDARDITIRVNAEPDLDNALNPSDICSGETIVGGNPGFLLRADPVTSIAATSFILHSVTSAGLTPGFSNETTGSGKPANAINDDSWVNTGNAPVDVIYEISPVTGTCVGQKENVVVRVNPSPAMKDGLSRFACSNANSEIVLLDNSPTSVAADQFDIVSITVGGLNIAPGATVGGLTADALNATPGLTADPNRIRGDQFINNTNDRIVVTYVVAPISAPALNSCRGPQKTITLTVEPQIISLSTVLDNDICSGEPIQITFASPTYNPADPTNPTVTFSYATLASAISGATVGNNLNEGAQITDVLVNSTNAPINVTYRITPRASAASNGAGCNGVFQDIVVKVQPKPKINAIANKTICAGTPVNLNLVSPSVPDAGSIKILVTSTSDPLVGGASNNVLVANNTILGDVLSNPTDVLRFVTYHLEVQNVDATDAPICTTTPIDVTVGVSPRPQFVPIPANFAICSGDSFNPIPITTNTENAVPGSTLVTWTVVANPSVSGESPGAGNAFSQVLFNNTTDKVVVTYTINASNIANNPTCAATPVPLLVTVYPNPKANNLPSSTDVCNNGQIKGNPTVPFTIKANTVAGLGATFDWAVPDNGSNPDLPLAAAGTNTNTIPQVFVNNGTALGTQTYSIKAHLTMAASDFPLIDASQGLDAVCESQSDAVMVVNVAPPVNGDIFGFDIEGNVATDLYLCRGATQFLYIDPVGLPLMTAFYKENGGAEKQITKLGGLATLQVKPTTTTTYELTRVVDKFSCEQLINKIITVNVDEVDNNLSIVGPTIGCSPFTVTFQHNQVNNTSYTWKWADGPDSTTYLAASSVAGKQIKHTYSNISPTRTVTLKASVDAFLDTTLYLNGCRKKAVTVNVGLYPTVAPAVFADKDVMCSDEIVAFTNSTQGASSHRWFYRVTGSSTELDVKTTPIANFKIPNTTNSNPIVYEVVYRSSNGNCPAPDVVTPITVYRGVDAHFSHTVPTIFVGGHSGVTFTNDSAPVDAADFRYEWEFGLNANPETANGAGPTYVLDYTTPGPKEVRLIATNILAETVSLSCTDEYVETINIVVPPLIAEFTAVPLFACFPTDITVTENKATGDKFAWRVIDNAGTAAQSNADLPVFKIPAPGKYTIELTTSNSFTGDQKTATQDVIIYDLPMASFDFRPGLVYVPDTELTTYNFSDGATMYTWDFGDGTTEDTKEPTHVYKIEGVYDITLIAMNDHGGGVVCADTLIRKVTAKQGGVTRVPNAFTPNPNGPTSSAGTPGIPGSNSFNDVFLPQVKGAEEFNMQVFDRWGNLIFESNNSNVGWDGYDKHGKLLPAGVYVYKLTLRLSDGQRTTQVGDITMIR